jgi:hypothetical protein
MPAIGVQCKIRLSGKCWEEFLMRSDVLANIAVAILRVAFLGVLEAHTCVE